MSAPKFPIQTFEDFRGIDLLSSPLTRKATNALRLTNYKYANQRALTGRRGKRCVAQPIMLSGMGTYSYADKDTGETVQELIGVTDHLWRLREGSFTITRTAGAATFGLSFYIDTDPTSGTYQQMTVALVRGATVDVSDTVDSSFFRIYDLIQLIDAHADYSVTHNHRFAVVNGNQSAVATVTVAAGHNYVAGDVASLFTHGGSAGSLNTQLTSRVVLVSLGTSLAFGGSFGTLNVRNGQVMGPLAALVTGLKFNKGAASDSRYTSAGADTLTITFPYWEPIPFDYDSRFSTFAIAPFSSHETASKFTSLGTIYNGYKPVPVVQGFQNATLVNGDNSLYITTYDDTPDKPGYYQGRLWKYDGTSVYRAGMPPMRRAITTADVPAGSLTGTYKYMARYAFKDNWGVEVFGRPSSDYNEVEATPSGENITLTVPTMRFSSPTDEQATVNGNQVGTTITVTAGHGLRSGDVVSFLDRAASVNRNVTTTVTSTTATTVTIGIAGGVTVNNGDVIFKDPYLGFKQGGAVVSGNQSNVNTITVVTSPTSAWATHQIYVGDTVFFYDGEHAEYTEREVTAVTNTTITVAGDPVDVTDAAPISKNLRIEIYRTKNAGDTYYHLATVVHSPTEQTVTYTDSTADNALGAIFEDQELGREFDLPPKSRLCCVHQGLMITASHPSAPNSVNRSLSDGLEYFPEANRGFDVPASAQGPITAIASDSEDRLAVFKATAFYDCVGDLDVAPPVTRAITEGDYGVEAQASLLRVAGSLVGMGRLGLMAVAGGTVIDKGFAETSIGRMIRPQIIRQDLANQGLSRAIAVNDYPDRGYLISTPLSGLVVSNDDEAVVLATRDGLENFFFDYERGTWFDWTMPAGNHLVGGAAVLEGELYVGLLNATAYADYYPQGGLYKRCESLSPISSNVSPGHMYADIHRATDGAPVAQCVPYELIISAIDLGMPSYNKELQNVILYTLPEDEFALGAAEYHLKVFRGRLLPQNFHSWPVVSEEVKQSFGGAAATDLIADEESPNYELVFDVKREQVKAATIGVFMNGSTFRSGTDTTEAAGFFCPYITGIEYIFAGSSRNEDRRP